MKPHFRAAGRIRSGIGGGCRSPPGGKSLRLLPPCCNQALQQPASPISTMQAQLTRAAAPSGAPCTRAATCRPQAALPRLQAARPAHGTRPAPLSRRQALRSAPRCQATAAAEPAFEPQVCVVLGTQWGDEGKGKLVDILAQQYEIVARAQVRWAGLGGRSGPASWHRLQPGRRAGTACCLMHGRCQAAAPPAAASSMPRCAAALLPAAVRPPSLPAADRMT